MISGDDDAIVTGALIGGAPVLALSFAIARPECAADQGAYDDATPLSSPCSSVARTIDSPRVNASREVAPVMQMRTACGAALRPITKLSAVFTSTPS